MGLFWDLFQQGQLGRHDDQLRAIVEQVERLSNQNLELTRRVAELEERLLDTERQLAAAQLAIGQRESKLS